MKTKALILPNLLLVVASWIIVFQYYPLLPGGGSNTLRVSRTTRFVGVQKHDLHYAHCSIRVGRVAARTISSGEALPMDV